MRKMKIDKELLEQKALASGRRVLNFQEACLYTGYAQSYMYKLTASKIVPHSKPNGKHIFFNREELDTWLLSNRSVTSKEINLRAVTHIGKSQL